MRIYKCNNNSNNNNTKEERSLSDKSESSEMSGSFTKITSSSSSASSSVNFPANCRKSSPSLFNNNKKVNISMNRFINSKGLSASKDKSFFSPFLANGDPFLRNTSDEYYELKPPQFVKKDLTLLKRRVSAVSKIQEEMKQMKEREEELKWNRVRSVGASQPNLTTLSDESDDNSCAQSSEQHSLFERTNSNPNLIDSNDSEEDSLTESDCRVGGPRRRISLIAVWEQKIQKEVKIKN